MTSLSPNGSIKVVSYDIWKTLLAGNKAFTAPRMQLLVERLGLTASIDQMVTAYRASDKHFNDNAEVTGLDGGMAERLAMMFDILGYPASQLPDTATMDELQASIGALRCRPEYMPPLLEQDLLETFDRIAALGIRQVLISNTGMDSGPVMRPVLGQLGILPRVEQAFFSAELGVAKPNPAIYKVVAEKLGAEPTSILHVGDNLRADYNGATAAGCQALHYATVSDVPHITHIRQLPGLLATAIGQH